MERKKFTSIGDALDRFLADSPLSDGLRYSRVCQAWDDAVGASVVSMTLGRQFDNGILTVRLGSSVLRMQMEMNKEVIRRRMNQTLGAEVVKTINLR